MIRRAAHSLAAAAQTAKRLGCDARREPRTGGAAVERCVGVLRGFAAAVVRCVAADLANERVSKGRRLGERTESEHHALTICAKISLKRRQ